MGREFRVDQLKFVQGKDSKQNSTFAAQEPPGPWQQVVVSSQPPRQWRKSGLTLEEDWSDLGVDSDSNPDAEPSVKVMLYILVPGCLRPQELE